MADNKMEKSIKEAIGKSLNEFNKRIGMAKLIKDNKNQDRILKGILSQVNDENIEKTEKSNVITLDNSTDGIVELQEIKGDTNVNVSKIEKETPITHVIDDKNGNVISLDGITEGAISIDNIQGNTMVNCNKDTDKELILMPNLDTSGYSNVTLTEGIDGGKVDVSLEGNTMVNVCEQEDSIAITKSYTVETGNHIALQGEYDGKCRPNIYGNTMVNCIRFNRVSTSGTTVEENKYIFTRRDVTETNTSAIFKSILKDNTKYTMAFDIIKNDFINGDDEGNRIEVIRKANVGVGYVMPIKSSIGHYMYTFTTNFSSSNISDSTDEFWIGVQFSELKNKTEFLGEIIIGNVVVLEGDYTNKPIPDYFTGMKSSFEDKLVPEDLMTTYKTEQQIEYLYAGSNPDVIDLSKIKPNTKYTLIYKAKYKESGNTGCLAIEYNEDKTGATILTNSFTTDYKQYKNVFITPSNVNHFVLRATGHYFLIKDCMLVEGDWSNQDYDSAKGGKYKVDYKVTGKNKFDSSIPIVQKRFLTKIKKGQSYTLSYDYTEGNTGDDRVQLFTSYIFNQGEIGEIIDSVDYAFARSVVGRNTVTVTSAIDGYLFMRVVTPSSTLKYLSNIQIEEGTTATTYEPYKESIKTLYLNSPLLEGDTIEQSGNNIIHNHRYGKVVLDGKNYSISRSGTYDSTKYRWILYKNDNILKFTGNRGILINDRYPLSSPIGAWGSNNNYIEGITINSQDPSILLYLDKYKDGSDNSRTLLIAELQQNPVTVVYELKTPTQEIISTNDNLLLDSYTNGHLDVDSVVPIDKVMFKMLSIPLKYVNANTDYTFQFESDNVGKLNLIYMNGASLSNIDVVKGLNKITCTTLDKGYRTLDLSGIGFNASKVVVTPKVDNNFGYFKGMKSVGECEDNKIEILSNNENLFDGEWELGGFKTNGSPSTDTNQFRCVNPIKVEPNTRYSHSSRKVIHYLDKDLNQITYDVSGALIFDTPSNCHYINIRTFNADFVSDFKNFKYMLVKGENMPTTHIDGLSNKKEILLNEPLRGLPNGIRDKYILIDGKWYIERNVGCKDLVVAGGTNWGTQVAEGMIGFHGILNMGTNYNGTNVEIVENIVCDELPSISRSQLKTITYDAIIRGDSYVGITVKADKLETQDLDGFKKYINSLNAKFIYNLTTPTYEPIDYNPFEVYTDITHISNNSTIPCNMVIKNSGFNCILKPNTTYTVSSNNGLSTVTTKDSIDDSILRFYNKDTSKITKMSNVLVLEGDYVTGNPPIPAFFKGMESAFEQELVTDEKDEHYGKYKVNVKAVGKNLLDETKGVINSSLGNSKTMCIKVKPNTTYVYSSSVYKGAIAMYKLPSIVDNDTSIQELGNMGYKEFSIVDGKSFTTHSSTNYIFMNYDGTSNVQIEIGTKATEYEPYKENNITFYINEPLRGIGDIKDKVYVKEDKVVVERNCGSVTFDGSNDEDWRYWKNSFLQKVRTIDFYAIYNNKKQGTNVLCNSFASSSSSYMYDIQGMSGLGGSGLNIWVSIDKIKLQTQDVAGFRKYLQQNPTTVVYQLATPVYEEVEYSNNRLTLNTYNNSTLFYNSNIPISNTSFKPLWEELIYIKNSTTYYIQFNAVGNGDVVVNLGGTELTTAITEGYNKIEITTPNKSTNLLTIDGQGIKISKVVVSEALCSGYYKGLQSCFEEHMENGKYVCVIRGISLDGNKVNGIKFYLNEPLRGIGDIKDRLCIKNSKLMVERNCGSATFDGSDDENWSVTGFGGHATRNTFEIALSNINGYTRLTPSISNSFNNEIIEGLPLNDNAFRVVTEVIGNSYFLFTPSTDIIPYRDIDKWKKYLQQNPIKAIYQLQTPVYEEVTNEYGLPIILEGYENGIVYVDSSVTPTTSIKYTSNNKVPTTLSNVDNLNTATQNDINNNIVTYMMDIDMMLTEMEMDDSASTMSLSDLDDNNQNHDSSHSNILDRMNKEDRIKYQDNTTKMLEKVIKGKSLTKDENINRIDLYLSEGKIREEQSNYLKELLKGVE